MDSIAPSPLSSCHSILQQVLKLLSITFPNPFSVLLTISVCTTFSSSKFHSSCVRKLLQTALNRSSASLITFSCSSSAELQEQQFHVQFIHWFHNFVSLIHTPPSPTEEPCSQGELLRPLGHFSCCLLCLLKVSFLSEMVRTRSTY